MAILSKAVQEAITQEIADVMNWVDQTFDQVHESAHVAELVARNLYYRGLIDKEAAFKVFEATHGDMSNIMAWAPECDPEPSGFTKRPPIRIDNFMREDIWGRAHSLGVVTSLPELTMAWEDPILGLKLSTFVNPEHVTDLLSIIERKQEEELERRRPETFKCSRCECDALEEFSISCPGCGKDFCGDCYNIDIDPEEDGCHKHPLNKEADEQG